ADLLAAASPPVSPMPKPIVIGSAALAAQAERTQTATAAAARKQPLPYLIICYLPKCPHYSKPALCKPGSLFARSNEAVDAVGVGHTLERTLIHQIMQVCEGLAERETHLVLVERPPEKDRQQLDGGLRNFAGGCDVGAACSVMRG